jgi:hypothetical protein
MNVICAKTGKRVIAYAKVLMTHRTKGRIDTSYLIIQGEPGHASDLNGLKQIYDTKVLYCHPDVNLYRKLQIGFGWVDAPKYMESPIDNESALSFLHKEE